MRPISAFIIGLGLLLPGCGDEGISSPPTVAASSAVTTASVATPSEPVLPFGAELQRALERVLGADAAMGVSLAVMVPGYEPWLGVAGDSEPGMPVTTGMAFCAGSISKSFIAALVLQLVEEGKLALDDPLEKWLPDYPNVDSRATIRQLLNHTSGLFQPNHHPDFFPTVFADGTRVWTDDEILSTFLAEPYSAEGTEWHYSNAGYTLVGQIIEAATGSSVSAELRGRFFQPLGLTSAFYLTEESAPGEVAEGWMDIGLYAPAVDPGPGAEPFSQFPWTATIPEAGGVFANTGDLATWAQALFHDQRVLAPESLDQMLQFVAPEPDDERGVLLVGYGLGAVEFNPDLFEGTRVIGHSGGALFYSAASFYLPDYGVAIGAAQNFDNDDTFGSTLEQVVGLVTAHVEPTP
jgi:D-alanyl-D-alanine carboxypeptidase